MRSLFIFTLATAALLAGCKDPVESTVPEMDAPESVARVREVIENNIDPAQYKLLSIRWSEGEELSNRLELLELEMVGTEGTAWRQSFTVGDPGPATTTDEAGKTGMVDKAGKAGKAGKTGVMDKAGNAGKAGEIKSTRRGKTFDFATVPHITPYDMDAEVIMSQLHTAKTMIDVEMYDIRSVGQYEIKIDPVSALRRTSFIVRITDKQGATRREGQNTVTTYYEIRFDVDGEGNVTMKEE
jgi:hypothetical protein